MVADAQAIERRQPFEDVVSDDVLDFRGSFSGYERDRLFYNPDGSFPGFIQSAYVFGLDLDHDGRSAVPVDIDGDGDLDLAVLSAQGLRLFENTSEPKRFARIRLVADGRRPALGATVELQASGVDRRDFVRITDGFRSQVPADLHFGLGDAAAIDRLEVRWPSGRVERWSDLPADRLLVVREGAARVDARPLPRWPEGTRPRLPERASPTAEADRLGGGRALLAGRGPAVINFWAPWCAPCNVELPQLVNLAERYDAEVQFAGVSVELEDLESVRAMIDRFAIPYPQFLADDEVMERFFGAAGAAGAALPSTFVFDGEGRLRRLFRGAVNEQDLDALLESFRDEGVAEAELSLAARLAFEAGDYASAVSHYERLAVLEPDSLAQVGVAWEHRRAVDRLRLGVARLRAGDAARAVRDLQTARRLLGDGPIVLLRLGVAAARAGELDLAAETLQRAVRTAPASVAAWLNKARVHRRLGQTDEARTAYERVLSLDAYHAPAQRELADLRELLRR